MQHLANESEVLKRINGFIDVAFDFDDQVNQTLSAQWPAEQAASRAALKLSPSGSVFGPPSKYLRRALELSTAARKANSLDLVGRDAQYYFHTRSRVAATRDVFKPGMAFLGLGAAIGWDLFKLIVPETVGQRTDAENPKSPPGGWTWAVVGVFDGMSDSKHERGKPRYAVSTPRKELEQMVQSLTAPMLVLPAR